MNTYEECEDMATLLDDGVVWLEIAEQIKDMEYVTNLKGLADLDHCFHMKCALDSALGSLDVAGTGRPLQRGYIKQEEYAEAEKLIKPLEDACHLPVQESRELFSKAIKHVRELMVTRTCRCLTSVPLGLEEFIESQPELLDSLAKNLHIKRHGEEVYYRGEGGETLERIEQKAEEYNEVFIQEHPEIADHSITVYHDPIQGEDLAVVDNETDKVVAVFNNTLKSQMTDTWKKEGGPHA